jgi:DNA-binding Xre family transcriptional regulator
MYSKTELKNILRIYSCTSCTLTSLAAELGITKSYLSKIINGQVSSVKYEKLIKSKIKKLLKNEPENVNKNAPRWKFRYFSQPVGIKEIPLRNGIQDILNEKKLDYNPTCPKY